MEMSLELVMNNIKLTLDFQVKNALFYLFINSLFALSQIKIDYNFDSKEKKIDEEEEREIRSDFDQEINDLKQKWKTLD